MNNKFMMGSSAALPYLNKIQSILNILSNYTIQTTWPEYNKPLIYESNIFKLTSNWFPPLIDISIISSFFLYFDYPINNKRLYNIMCLYTIQPKVKKKKLNRKGKKRLKIKPQQDDKTTLVNIPTW